MLLFIYKGLFIISSYSIFSCRPALHLWVKMNTLGNKINVLRTILRGMKHLTPEKGQLRQHPSYMYIIDQYRKNVITDQQYCRQQEELAFLAETYATYLDSLKK